MNIKSEYLNTGFILEFVFEKSYKMSLTKTLNDVVQNANVRKVYFLGFMTVSSVKTKRQHILITYFRAISITSSLKKIPLFS